MRRTVRAMMAMLVGTAGMLATLGVSVPAAQASVNTPVAGVSTDVGTSGGVAFAGYCNYEYVGAGVGGGGATYAINGAGTATGTNVLDTEVICTVTQNGVVHSASDGFLPGDAAVAAGTFKSDSLSTGLVCTTIEAFLRNGMFDVSRNC